MHFFLRLSLTFLQVFVDIMIHFGRRGRENLSNLTRRDFAVSRDPDGALYVYKTKDESTKNHQMDEAKSSDGRMYEVKGKCIRNLNIFNYLIIYIQ